jgi:hypothetical protein
MPPRDEVDQRLLKVLEELERNEQRRKEERTTANAGINHVLREVQGLRKEVGDELKQVRQDVKGVQARVTILEDTKRKTPSLPPPGGYASGEHELSLPASKSGTVKMEDVQAAWAQKLTELDDEVRLLRAEKDAQEKLRKEQVANAEQLRRDQAQQAEASRKRLWFYVKVAAAIMTPLLPALGVIATKLFHL